MTTKKPEKRAAAPGDEIETSFEKSLERLEKLVSEMEGGSLSLEEMIGRFEEGQKLIGFCTGKLNEVERKIEILVKRGDAIVPEPFEEDGSDEPEDVGKDGEKEPF